MKHSALRILQVGLGARGQMWAKIIANHADAVCVGGVDISEKALHRFSTEYPDTPTFSSLTEALPETEADAVLLVTPPVNRSLHASEVFRAGLPLLAEKPLTLDLGEAAAIVRAAQDAQLPLMVGLNFRYLPISQKIRELVLAKTFGEPGFGHFIYHRNRDGRLPHLNKYPLSMQHPMMLEQSIHHLDLIRYCYGREVAVVSCHTWNPSWSMYAHHSNVHCLLTLEGGMEVNYFGTWTGGWNQLQFQWRTDCSGGVIVQRQLFEDLAIAHIDDAELTPVELPPCRAFFDDTAALLGSFVSHLRNATALECSGLDHLRTLGLCMAAIESSETGRAVELREFYVRHNLLEPL